MGPTKLKKSLQKKIKLARICSSLNNSASNSPSSSSCSDENGGTGGNSGSGSSSSGTKTKRSKTSRPITELRLMDMDLTDTDLTRLSQSLSTNDTVSLLDLSRNPQLTPVGVKSLATALLTNTSITDLRLNGNKQLGDDGIIHLCQALRFANSSSSSGGVVRLYLRRTNCGRYGARALATAVRDSSSLALLDLADNKRIGDKGVKMLGDALAGRHLDDEEEEALPVSTTRSSGRKNRTGRRKGRDGGGGGGGGKGDGCPNLRRINLAGTAITDVGATSLIAALEVNATLTHLDLYGNSGITDLTASSLVDALWFNRSLKDLNLGGTGIGAAGKKLLVGVLEENETLTRCIVSGVSNSGGAGGAGGGGCPDETGATTSGTNDGEYDGEEGGGKVDDDDANNNEKKKRQLDARNLIDLRTELLNDERRRAAEEAAELARIEAEPFTTKPWQMIDRQAELDKIDESDAEELDDERSAARSAKSAAGVGADADADAAGGKGDEMGDDSDRGSDYGGREGEDENDSDDYDKDDDDDGDEEEGYSPVDRANDLFALLNKGGMEQQPKGEQEWNFPDNMTGDAQYDVHSDDSDDDCNVMAYHHRGVGGSDNKGSPSPYHSSGYLDGDDSDEDDVLQALRNVEERREKEAVVQQLATPSPKSVDPRRSERIMARRMERWRYADV